MDPTLMYEVVNRQEVDVILAYTSDGRIQKYKLKILDDDQSAIPSYSAMIVVSPNRAKNDPKLMKVLRRLNDKISLKKMQELNFLVDEKGYTTNESAAYFINKNLAGN